MPTSHNSVNTTTANVVNARAEKLERGKKELAKLGLTDNQSLVYLILLQHMKLRIQEIVNFVQIPRSSVYESLKTLQELGLVEEVIEDNFKKYQSYPISSIRHNLNEKIVQLQQQVTEVDKLEKILAAFPQSDPGTIAIRHYKGVAGARQLFWNSLRAKEVVYVYSAWGRGRYVGMKYYENFVAESQKRKIQEKVIINPTPRALDSIKKFSGQPTSRTRIEDIRSIDENKVRIKGESFIYDNIYAQVYLDVGQISGFEIESELFAFSQRSIFETLWGIATPLSQDL